MGFMSNFSRIDSFSVALSVVAGHHDHRSPAFYDAQLLPREADVGREVL